MRKTIPSALILVLLGTAPSLAQLPPEILADSYLLRSEQAISEGDRAQARGEIDKIILIEKEHELNLPDEFHFRYARAAFAADLPEQSLEAVVKYLTAAGREGRHYVEALELMIEAQYAIEGRKEPPVASTGQSRSAEAAKQGTVEAQLDTGGPTEAKEGERARLNASGTSEEHPVREPDTTLSDTREALERVPPPEIRPALVGSQGHTRNATQALDCKKWKKRSYWKNATDADVVACLDAGASPNARPKAKDTPLSMAAEHNENPNVFKILIAAGANLEARSWYRRTPLHVATIFNENPEVIKVLISAGAELEALADEKRTPLHTAAAHGTPEIIKTLVAAGANLEARDKYGQTPLHWATGMGLTNPPPLGHAQALLAAGANPNAQNRWGRRPKEEILSAARGTRTKKSRGSGGLGALIGVASAIGIGTASGASTEAILAGVEAVAASQQPTTGGHGPSAVHSPAGTARSASGSGSCEIPGYPSPPGGVMGLGLAWCPATVSMQVRSFALQAAGAQCAIATGSSSTPEQILARRQEIAGACGRLSALGESKCQCPTGSGGTGSSNFSSSIDRDSERREQRARQQEEAKQAAQREKLRIEAGNVEVLNSNCSCISIEEDGEYTCLDGLVAGNNSSRGPVCDIRR